MCERERERERENGRGEEGDIYVIISMIMLLRVKKQGNPTYSEHKESDASYLLSLARQKVQRKWIFIFRMYKYEYIYTRKRNERYTLI